jgi:hypothetical protein
LSIRSWKNKTLANLDFKPLFCGGTTKFRQMTAFLECKKS